MDIKSKALLKNTLIYTIGNLGSKLLNFGLLPIFSYYLTKEEFGYYDIVVTTIVLLVPIITLQLSDAVFRWLIDVNQENLNRTKVITNSFVIVFFNLVLFVVLGWISSFFIEISSVYLILLLLATSSIFPVIQQTVRGLGSSKLYATSGLIYSFVFLILNILLLVVFKLSINALFIASIFSNLVASIYLIIKGNIFQYFNLSLLSSKTSVELLRYSGPLVPNSISWWLIMSANKYIVLFFLGKEALGVFGFSNRFPGLLVMVNGIFIMAWQESAIVNFKGKEGALFFSKVFDLLVRVQLSFAIVLILGSEILIKTLVSPEFYEAWYYMPLLYLGASFSTFAGFYGSIYLSAKDTKSSFITTLAAGGVNLIVALSLVQYYGLYGVAFANCFSFLFLTIHRYKHTGKFILLNYVKSTYYIMITLIVLSFVIVYLQNTFLTIFSMLAVLPVLFYLNKPVINKLLYQIKNKIHGIS